MDAWSAVPQTAKGYVTCQEDLAGAMRFLREKNMYDESLRDQDCEELLFAYEVAYTLQWKRIQELRGLSSSTRLENREFPHIAPLLNMPDVQDAARTNILGGHSAVSQSN